MIPIHNSEKTNRKKIIVNRLSKLNDYDFSEPHRHDYFEFFYFNKGGGTHVVDFEDFEIKDNSIHIVAPGKIHQVKRSLDSNGFVCLFELDALSAQIEVGEFLFEHECCSINEMHPTYEFSQEQSLLITALASSISLTIGETAELNQISLRALIQNLTVECMKAIGEVGIVKDHDHYVAFRKLVLANFRQYKKVKEYAEQLAMSEKILGELVKQRTGKSTSEIIYDQIILEAKRLLLTGMSIKETAYDLNFEDPGHFSKFFKSKTGVSPSEFSLSL